MLNKKQQFFIYLNLFFLMGAPWVQSSEVLEENYVQVLTRQHPQTDRPYVVISSKENSEPVFHFQKAVQRYEQPDYRMLESDANPRDFNYSGPSSDRKKVYLFAATLAASGAAAGTLLPVAPAAGGAAGGAGAFAAGGAAVSTGTISAALWSSRTPPDQDDYTRQSTTRVITYEER